MSLTSIIKTKEARELFANEFKKPKGKILGEIKAPPLTNHYGLVGTAFDYLLRFCLKYHYPESKDLAWVADWGREDDVGKGKVLHIGKDGVPHIESESITTFRKVVDSKGHVVVQEESRSTTPFHEKRVQNLKFAKNAYSEFLKNEILMRIFLRVQYFWLRSTHFLGHWLWMKT